MRELSFDDAFWRDVLAALREPGQTGRRRLEEHRSGYADLIDGLVREAEEESCLIGGRPATAGKNPRLLLFLTAALLARRGVDTLYLDLSSELRWLEMLLGEDLKEGLVDHLQYDVTIDRCTRSTAIDRLDVLTGGAYFLAGSPLEDAPAFRAALERLRERYDAVVIAFPHPFDAAEAAGMPALCGAWIAIEEGEVEAPVFGNERAVIRLTGDPQAAWELARLSSAFLGPLPTILGVGEGAGSAGAPSAAFDPAGPGPEDDVPPLGEREAPAGGLDGRDDGEVAGGAADDGVPSAGDPPEDEDEVAFLRAFEGVVPPAARRSGSAPDPQEDSIDDPEPDRHRTPVEAAPTPEQPWEGRSTIDRSDGSRRRWGVVAVVAGLVVVAVLAVGLLADRFEPLFAGSDAESDWAVEWPADSAGEHSATVVALDGESDSIPLEEEDASEGEETVPLEVGAIDGEPAPYSLHVGSYQSREPATGVVESLAAAGHTGFLAPVDLGDRGRWFRVYAGAFSDSTSANRTLEGILGREIVEEGAVRRTPWSFRLAVHRTREEAEAAVEELDVSAYVTGDGPSIVWSGAFRSEEEAATMAATLEEAGIDAELTRRERPR
ncbi:MAG: SPOR domain-containing protein [Gemmatimonadota bacterium]|nr:SPOR domain-containing protein [Gemmatimonadota bacterium]